MPGPTVLVLVLVITLAAFGGIYPWALPGILIGALLLTAVAGPWARDPSTAPDVRALDRAIVLLVAAIAIQLLPLPLSIRAALSPHLADIEATIRSDAVVQDTSFQPLSLDPSGTWQALLLVVATALTYRAARIIFATGGIRVLCRALSAFGALAALGAVVQRAVSPTLIYGVWKPTDVAALPFGPVVNRNHFAAWLVMASAVTAGYLVGRLRTRHAYGPSSTRRTLVEFGQSGAVWTALLWIVITATVFVAQSRSAAVGLVAAFATFARASRRSWAAIAAGAAVLTLVAVALVVTGQRTATGLASRMAETLSPAEVNRVVIWRESLPIVRDFWTTGVGAGAYGRAMLTYQQTRGYAEHLGAARHFNQAHNHYLQLMSEGGVLLTVPFVLVAVLLVRLGARRLARDTTEMRAVRVGAIAGLAGIAVQSLWEVPLTMPAAALLAATLAALATYERARSGGALTTTTTSASETTRAAPVDGPAVRG